MLMLSILVLEQVGAQTSEEMQTAIHQDEGIWFCTSNWCPTMRTSIICLLKFLFVFHILQDVEYFVPLCDEPIFLDVFQCFISFELQYGTKSQNYAIKRPDNVNMLETTISKHLKGRFGPFVRHVTFLHQRRSVGAPCSNRNVLQKCNKKLQKYWSVVAKIHK